jgi:hypothetical protein
LAFGPGIIWASMSIGGGELVLIPRVGSVFGMVVLWMPLLAMAVPLTFLPAAAWVEGTFLLPVVALSIAYLTSVLMPRLFPEGAGGPYRPRWIFPVGTAAAAALYVILIVMLLRF